MQVQGSDKRGASYMSNLRHVYALAQQGDQEGIREHLGGLHYNEVRKIKVKLASTVDGHIEPVGRKKPEVIESIIAFLEV